MVRRWIYRAVLYAGRLLSAVGILALLYGGWILFSTSTGVARVDGTQRGVPVDAATTIARDERGVPHVRAGSIHDLFVAEGYAMGSDRLFQMDLTRRYVDGRLAEMLGPPLVALDHRMRRYAIRDLAARVYARVAPDERAELAAFADGVNAAAATQPAPPEYHALFFSFETWRPEDGLAVGFATVLDLDDSPDDVIFRDYVRNLLGQAGTDAFYPLTDPRYDVPTDGSPPGKVAPLPALGGASQAVAFAPADEKPPLGSNGWVAGAARTSVGKAVLANDPHLSITIPGIWYLFEGSAPGMHIAGAALAGTPGVTLGHNEHLAWGVTAGETAAMRVLKEARRGSDQFLENGRWITAHHRRERVGVRFVGSTDFDVLETPRGVVIRNGASSPNAYLMQWRMQTHPVSPLAPFTRLLTGRSVADGAAAMRALPEPALNVLFADDTGEVAYHFAGLVPLEPSWGRWAAAGDAPMPAFLSYDDAPRVDPSRDAFVVTSNNRPDGRAAPRLAPYWPPPYRAYEVRAALAAAADPQKKLTPQALAGEQSDAASPAELEFAMLVLAAAQRSHADADGALRPLVDALNGDLKINGKLVPESNGATAVVALRRDMLAQLAAEHLPPQLAGAYPGTGPGFEIVLRALRERPRGWVPRDDYDAFVVASMRRVQHRLSDTIPAFSSYAAQPLTHALAAFGFTLWNGPTLPGRGGSFAPAVQWNGHGQSFRALWIAGDWDAGTIDIAAGESGEPGSPHYADQATRWAQFARTPLPFSDGAVKAATRATLTLTR
jgi:penicillin amidase